MKVIKIGAVWCSGCLVMGPRWKEIEMENSWLATEYLDFDEDSEKVKIYGLDDGSLPTFIFLDKEGKELERLTGEISKEKLLEIIEKYKDR
ncbi:thioredoxin family protein [Patescibacteria group bacterium]|nr:thioredoxin family protein [Patescibacteria group bacterium]